MADKGTAKPSEEPQKKIEQTHLEEDDEFEEFDTEEWTAQQEDPNTEELWEEDWDDDQVSDDFSNQLRAELAKAKA